MKIVLMSAADRRVWQHLINVLCDKLGVYNVITTQDIESDVIELYAEIDIEEWPTLCGVSCVFFPLSQMRLSITIFHPGSSETIVQHGLQMNETLWLKWQRLGLITKLQKGTPQVAAEIPKLISMIFDWPTLWRGARFLFHRAKRYG